MASKTINKADLEAYHDQLMQDVILPMTGPTYDETNKSLNFPITAKATIDEANKMVIFN